MNICALVAPDLSTTTSANLVSFDPIVFDGNTTNGGYINIGPGTQDVILDFGENYNITQIKLWMYFDGRVFRNLAIYGSTDNTNWTTLRSAANWEAVEAGLTVDVSPAASYRYIKFYCEGNATWNSNEYLEIKVYDDNFDRAYNKDCYASEEYAEIYFAEYANDGLPATRWAGKGAPPSTENAWWSVDLGANYAINYAIISWEAANAPDYDIQYSDDNTNWTTAANKTGSGARIDAVSWTQETAHRYWRLYCNGTTTLISIWNLELYGEEGEAPQNALIMAIFI